MGRFSTRGEVARRERVEYALVRCTQLSTVVSDPRSTIHEPLSLPPPPSFFFVKKRKRREFLRNQPQGSFRGGRISRAKRNDGRRFPFARRRRKERRGGRSEKSVGSRREGKANERRHRHKRAAWKVVLLPLFFEDTLKRVPPRAKIMEDS